MASVRPAAVAGTFYPSDSRALVTELDDLLGGVEHLAPRLGFPKALVVPHAGYIYSGPVAARAYDELASARGIVSRVVMLGPVHRVPVRGLAIPTDEAFATPLGTIAIDRAALEAVRDLPQVVASDSAHLQEHALEVQLPFLSMSRAPRSRSTTPAGRSCELLAARSSRSCSARPARPMHHGSGRAARRSSPLRGTASCAAASAACRRRGRSATTWRRTPS